MVRKKLAMAVLALSALQADVASALGVGNVSVRSALNQPLNAEIRLLETGDLDSSQIKVGLAPLADFERAGVDRDYFLGNLRFSIELDGRGGGVVRITTREPVVEPYLNFIIETRWPSGRLLREYAVLLDLPTFSEGARVPFVPAGSSGLATVQQQTRSAAPAPAAAPRSAPADDWSMPGAGPGEYRVQQNDTMGRIAARLRPSGDVSLEQAMLAIQRANPQAFIRNNVNLVKAGHILRVPSADEMRTLSTAEATQEMAAQNSAWRSGETYQPGSGSVAGTAGPQLDARSPSATGTDEGGFREQGRLSIATPGDSDRATTGEGAGSSGAGSEALRSELASAQEGLDSARRDNSELQSRLDDMERQVATLNRLITLKDEQLAALQTRGQEQLAAAADTSEPGTESAEPVDETTEPVAEVTDPSFIDEPAFDAAAPMEEEPVAEAAPAQPEQPAKPAPAPQPGLLEQLTANPLIPAAGAGVLALLLGGVLLARRRKAAEQEPMPLADDLSFDFEPAPVESENNADFDTALISDDKVAEAEAFSQAAAEEAPVQRVRSETGDAIAEADIYIAYGRYQQAVELLKGAIDAEPQRTDLRIKLLEVYLEMRDRDAFRRQFAELQQQGDEGAVAQVKEMLSSVDGVAGWLDDLPSSPSYAAPAAAAAAAAVTAFAATQQQDAAPAAEEFAGELDLDLDESLADDFADFDLPETAAESPLEQAPVGLADADLTFDSPAPVSEPTPTVAADEGLELDLADAELDLTGEELDLAGDDLDLALDDIGAGDEGLQDLALDFAPEPATTDLAGGDEFDLSALDDLAKQGGDELADLESATDFATESLAGLDELGGLDDLDLELGEAPAADQGFEPLADAVASAVDSSLADSPSDDAITPDAFTSDAFTADAVTADAAAEAPVSGGDDEFDFLADADEVATKLDLARAYIDMGDTDGARDILGEVMQEGTEAQRQDASALLGRIG